MSDVDATEGRAGSGTPSASYLGGAVFAPYVADWSEARRARIDTSLRASRGEPHLGRGVYEADVTALLESLTDAEDAVVRCIWRASSSHLGSAAVLPDGARLYRLDDFVTRGTWARRLDAGPVKLPDFVVAHPDPLDGSTGPEGRRLVPDVVVEFKGPADVNGGWGYCPDSDRYSNQVICYTHGCWLDLQGQNRADFDRVRFVWIGPDTSVADPGGPWGNRGLSERDLRRYPELREALLEQQRVTPKWAGLAISEVERTVARVPGGSALVADVLREWRTRVGI